MSNWDMSEFTFKDGRWWTDAELDPLNPLPYHERGFKMADDQDGTITDGQLECIEYDFESMKSYVDHFSDGTHVEERLSALGLDTEGTER